MSEAYPRISLISQNKYPAHADIVPTLQFDQLSRPHPSNHSVGLSLRELHHPRMKLSPAVEYILRKSAKTFCSLSYPKFDLLQKFLLPCQQISQV